MYSIYCLSTREMKSTFSPKHLFLFIGIFFSLGVAAIFSDEAAIKYLSGIAGVVHNEWVFETTIGNAGLVKFDFEPGVGYTRASIQDAGTLTGYFWTQTSGWAYFLNGSRIIPPPVDSIITKWSSEWQIWSHNAGWFELVNTEYDPVTNTLSGWIWGSTLGWIPLQTTLQNVGLGFVGRVKVIGNIAGRNIFTLNIANYEPGSSYDISTVSTVINDTRKKVALNLRNAGNFINTNFATAAPVVLKDAIYYSYTGSTSDPYVSYDGVKTYFDDATDARSLIVVGGDIYVDTGVILDADLSPRALIALKNDAGKWGNIYIRGDVTKIHATLVSEGSLYSARRSGAIWVLYNRDKIATLSLPNYQLYIRGSLISRNTIGWAWVWWTWRCPFGEWDCTYDRALRYDLNYFRDYQPDTLPPDADEKDHRWYTKTPLITDKSFIIEYDPRIATDPPPGF